MGISIGLSRLYYQLNEAGLLKSYDDAASACLIIPFDETKEEGLRLLKTLRDEGIRCIFYGESGKIGKKFKYADHLNVAYAIVLGQAEVDSNMPKLRNMKTGEETAMTPEEIVYFLKNEA